LEWNPFGVKYFGVEYVFGSMVLGFSTLYNEEE
jgi:hypothetical protein